MQTKTKHDRKSIRLKNYNYAKNGYYFITICTQNHKKIFGKIENNEMQLNQLGKIAYDNLENLQKKQLNIELDTFIIMPNHIHAIIIIEKNIQNNSNKITVGKTIGIYKSIVFYEYLNLCKQKNIKTKKLWQRNFYEHIIRNEEDLWNTQEYIKNNPSKWENDNYNF